MRYAVLSDIHGNLEALEAVLADAAPRTDALLCLGDLVGYGADPVACVEIVAERAQSITCGNHEHGVAGLLALDWFNPHARAAAEWTRERLDDDHRTYLAGLPLVTVVGLQFGYIIGGAVVIETVFTWPGVGLFTIQAILNRDYPVVQASVFILATAVVLINLAVDLLYVWLDPRIRVA